MKYWWVNHKQTFKSEFLGGYIWSPTKNKNGSFNKSYQNLTLTEVGDMVFSYSDTVIKAIGIVSDQCKDSIIPQEFGSVGEQWDKNGYLVKIDWTELGVPFKPKDHIHLIEKLLPEKYSPIQKNGNGNQVIYLAKINNNLAETLITLINIDNQYLIQSVEEIEMKLEEEKEQLNIENDSIPITEKEQLIKARVGQGIFRTNLNKVEKCCRLTGITNSSFLVASHIKPWCESKHHEKLDGNNGLLLSPHVDRLFDRGWISFSDLGDLLIKDDSVQEIINKWSLSTKNVGKFNIKQQNYLAYHREKYNFIK